MAVRLFRRFVMAWQIAPYPCKHWFAQMTGELLRLPGPVESTARISKTIHIQ